MSLPWAFSSIAFIVTMMVAAAVLAVATAATQPMRWRRTTLPQASLPTSSRLVPHPRPYPPLWRQEMSIPPSGCIVASVRLRPAQETTISDRPSGVSVRRRDEEEEEEEEEEERR